MMFLITIVCCLIWFALYRYSRRDLYKYAAKIPQVESYPLIGSPHVMMDVHNLRQMCNILLEKYGYTIIVWIFWIPMVIIADPKHLKVILNSPHCLDKDPRYNLAEDVLGNGLFTSPGHLWKRQRKLLNPAFSRKIVDSFVEVFVKHSEVLVQRLEKEAGKPGTFDANDYLSKCSLDFICETAMGTSVNAQNSECKILATNTRLAEILVERGVKVYYHLNLIFWCSPLAREFYRLCKYMHEFTGKIIEKRYKEIHNNNAEELVFDENKKKPFLEHLLSMEGKFTLDEIKKEVQLFIVAGSDTVSTTVTYALVSLGMHQDVQQKVHEELFEIFGNSDRPLELSDLPNLDYLDRVIKETLRMYPPAPFGARRVNENVDLGDFILPKGATAMVALSGTHRNPDYWDDPLKFDPDRFLPEAVAKRHPYAYIPFFGGPRNCIGLPYAMQACRVILANVMRSYRVYTPIRPETIRFKTEVTSKIFGGANISIEKLVT